MAEDFTRIQPTKRSSLALRAQETGELHELAGEMLVGREVECDIQLDSRKISRYHAKLITSPNGLYVEDLNSSNGTFVNQQQIRTRTHVGLGDELSFDEISFRVTTARSGDAESTQLAGPRHLVASNVEHINRIGPQELKPAPPTDDEKARELPPLKPVPSSGIKPAPPPKVHEIADMEAFLRHAGSGLKPQKPLEGKASIPFGLSRTQEDIPAATSELDNKLVERAERPAEQRHNELEPRDKPKDDASRESQPQTVDEDEATRHLSMNALNRYASTNKHFNAELNLGSGPRLIAMTAPIRGKVFALSASDDVKCWSLGRDDSADVCIRDKAVSREHAWITKLDSLYQLRVNDAAGGIFVNGKSCTETTLRHGDRLQFGAMELVFKLDVNTGVADNSGTGDSKLKSWFAALKIKLFN